MIWNDIKKGSFVECRRGPNFKGIQQKKVIEMWDGM
jgi:hypothetical protein